MKRHPLHLPLLAALLLSAAAHAVVAVFAGGGDPLAVSPQRGPDHPERSMLQASLAAPKRLAERESMPRVAAVDAPPSAAAKSARERPASTRGSVEPVAGPMQEIGARGDDESARLSPSPLTYPVISLPSDDDPRRIGFVRLLLVVSSEGRVVQTVVADATLSQDYVDRIAHGFDDVRFKPASAHGFPRPGWYEVVVDLEFDPGARSAL